MDALEKRVNDLERQLGELKTLVNGMASRMRDMRNEPFRQAVIEIIDKELSATVYDDDLAGDPWPDF